MVNLSRAGMKDKLSCPSQMAAIYLVKFDVYQESKLLSSNVPR